MEAKMGKRRGRKRKKEIRKESTAGALLPLPHLDFEHVTHGRSPF
jgi:hypothetical protein